MVGIEAKTEVHAKNWTSRMISNFFLLFLPQKMPLSSFFPRFHRATNINDGLVHAGSIRNVVLCHMATKPLQVRPDNNQGINTALLATSMVRTMWEERGWFSPLTFQ